MDDTDLLRLADDGCPHADPDALDECRHEWRQEYYGHRCGRCDLFYPSGSAPWETTNPWGVAAEDDQ